MKKLFVIFCSIFLFFHFGSAQEEVLFFQTNWGYEGEISDFIKKAKDSGYDGVEIWSNTDPDEKKIVADLLKKFDMKVIFLCGSNPSFPFEKSLEDYKSYLQKTLEQKPLAINSHTGSDFYNYEQNMAFIREANRLSEIYGIPIYHETHRGRFSYSLTETVKYLNIDEINLTLDISHWMVVHESLLNNRNELLEKILNQTNHIHARVGFEEAPQVNDPRAPEWKEALDRHVEIWEDVILNQWSKNRPVTITTEFGPPNYMPTEPVTMKPLSDQWEVNVFIMNYLNERIKILRNK